MRTTLDIDDELLAALMAKNPHSSKRAAIENAIREYVRRDAIEGLLSAAGTIRVEDVSADARRADRHT